MQAAGVTCVLAGGVGACACVKGCFEGGGGGGGGHMGGWCPVHLTRLGWGNACGVCGVHMNG